MLSACSSFALKTGRMPERIEQEKLRQDFNREYEACFCSLLLRSIHPDGNMNNSSIFGNLTGFLQDNKQGRRPKICNSSEGSDGVENFGVPRRRFIREKLRAKSMKEMRVVKIRVRTGTIIKPVVWK